MLLAAGPANSTFRRNGDGYVYVVYADSLRMNVLLENWKGKIYKNSLCLIDSAISCRLTICPEYFGKIAQSVS